MFGVDECRQPAALLRVGNDMEHERGLAGRFRPENLNDTTARHAADAQRQIKRERAGGDHINLRLRARVAQPHDAPVTIGLGDGRNGGVQLALAGGGEFGNFSSFRFEGGFFNGFRGHKIPLRFLIRNNGRARASQLLPCRFEPASFSSAASTSGSRTSTQRSLISRPAMRCPAEAMALMASVNSYSPLGDL